MRSFAFQLLTAILALTGLIGLALGVVVIVWGVRAVPHDTPGEAAQLDAAVRAGFMPLLIGATALVGLVTSLVGSRVVELLLQIREQLALEAPLAIARSAPRATPVPSSSASNPYVVDGR